MLRKVVEVPTIPEGDKSTKTRTSHFNLKSGCKTGFMTTTGCTEVSGINKLYRLCLSSRRGQIRLHCCGASFIFSPVSAVNNRQLAKLVAMCCDWLTFQKKKGKREWRQWLNVTIKTLESLFKSYAKTDSSRISRFYQLVYNYYMTSDTHTHNIV